MNVIRLIIGFLYKPFIKNVGSNFRPHTSLNIKGGKNIIIGNNFNSMGIGYLFGNEGVLIIGNNFSMNTNVSISASDGEIVIGNDVLIGPNVVIRCSNHRIKKGKPIRDQGHDGGKIIIEDDVWIGSNAVILKDVVIKKGSVIAAGTILTKDTIEYGIYAGIPGKLIKMRYE